MNAPLFAFTTPRYADTKDSRSKALRHDYSMLKLYSDGKVVYRYYKIEDPHPSLQNRTFQLSEQELKDFLVLLAKGKEMLLAYEEKRPLPYEAKRLQHTLIHAYNHKFLIPDYILDEKNSVYRERYAYYPEETTKAYYLALYTLVETLHQDALAHQIYFAYQEHSEK